MDEELAVLARAFEGRLTLLLLPPLARSPVEARILERCAASGWSCVSLRERFDEFAARYESPYGFANSAWGQGHMNAAGHHAAAEILTTELARLRALDLL